MKASERPHGLSRRKSSVVGQGLACFLFASTVATSLTLADVHSAETDNKSVENVSGVLVEFPGGLPARAEIDLGSIHGGQENARTIQLLNAGELSITFDGVQQSCNCASVKPESGVIEPGQTFEFQIAIKPAKFTQRIDGSVLVGLINQGREVANLVFLYKYANFHGFKPRSVTGRIVDFANDYKFYIAVDSSHPEQLTNFSVDAICAEGGPAFSGRFDAKLRAFELIVPKEMLAEQDLRGQLLLVDSDKKVVDRIPMHLEAIRDVEVYPSIMRFRKSDDEYAKAIAIVAMPPSSAAAAPPLVKVSIGNRELQVQVERLGASRVKLLISAKHDFIVAEAESQRLQFSIRSNEKHFERMIPFVVQ